MTQSISERVLKFGDGMYAARGHALTICKANPIKFRLREGHHRPCSAAGLAGPCLLELKVQDGVAAVGVHDRQSAHACASNRALRTEPVRLKICRSVAAIAERLVV